MHFWTVQYLIFIRMAFEDAGSYMRRTQSGAQNGHKPCSAAHSHTSVTCNYCTLIKDKVWVCWLNPPLLRACELWISTQSTSARQHGTADLSSAAHSCQSEEPLPLSVCLPTIQLYTNTQVQAREAHTHARTQSLSFCWEWVLMLRDYFSCVCVWEEQKEREAERACDLLECSG